MAICTLLVLLVLLHQTGDLLGAEVKTSIIGGEDAAQNQWPWMIHLIIVPDDGKDEWVCGATILSDEWLLTAASCWRNFTHHMRWDNTEAWIGAYDLNKEPRNYSQIVSVIRHPNFTRLDHGYENDISLVKMKKKIVLDEKVKAVKLPRSNNRDFTKSECWILGWGDGQNNVRLLGSGILQQLKIPILSPSACKKTFSHMDETMLCAGYLDGGKDACQGDYGGPLMCREAKGFVQVGITSFGSRDGCGLLNQPSIYTQVSKYLSFIKAYTNVTVV